MLLLPLGPVDREVRRWPWVTLSIVALNVLVYVVGGPAELSSGDPSGVAALLGFDPAYPSPWSAVTAAFVHADAWHLMGNMVFILATGPFLEDAYGRVLFPFVYFGSAIAGCYANVAFGGRHTAVMVGASAASFGIEGAFAVRFATRPLRYFLAPVGPLPFPGFRVRVPAVIVLLFGFVEQLFLVGSSEGHVAFGAHVAGFEFGALAAVVIWAAGIESRIHPVIEAKIGWQQHPLILRARAARFAGNHAHALRDVKRLLWEQPGNPDAWALAAQLALDVGDGAEAVHCAARAIPLYLGRNETDPAADVALDVLRQARADLTPRFGGLAAALMERRGQTVDAVSIYEDVAARFPAHDAGVRAAARLTALRPQRAG